jgi:hypothetical protein
LLGQRKTFSGDAAFIMRRERQQQLVKMNIHIGILNTVVREPGTFLFQLAIGDVVVTFDFQCCHKYL